MTGVLEPGRVHCTDCDAPFPALEAFVAAALGFTLRG
jgi:hypothetical protein